MFLYAADDEYTYTSIELWKSALKTQFQLEGYHDSPNPTCAKLPIPQNTTRKSEVLLMQMMYKNNVTNDSLYKLGRVPSPLCSLCKSEEDTADHILFRCRGVDEELRSDVASKYRLVKNLNEAEDIAVDFIDIINCSRDKCFITSCLNVINSVNLRVTIEL